MTSRHHLLRYIGHPLFPFLLILTMVLPFLHIWSRLSWAWKSDERVCKTLPIQFTEEINENEEPTSDKFLTWRGDWTTHNLSSQMGLILPQCGHLMLDALNPGGTLNLVPQSQVMVL